jgi:hypothetical protein
MKKILLVLVVLLSVFFGYSQTPNGKSAPVGNAGLTQWNKGVSLSDSGYQFISVADTFAANRGWLKGIPGLLLRVADTLLYIRNQAMTRWVLVGNGGSIFPSPSVGGLFWNGSNYIWEGLIGDVTSTGNSTTLSTVNSNPGVYGDSTKTLIATVDSKGRISNITVKTISVGDTTLRGQVIPSLITGILRYTGSNWVFDPTSYATNANLSLKKDISDSTAIEGYTTRYKNQQDSIALQNQINTNTTNIATNTTAINTKVNKADSSNVGVGGYATPTQLATKQNTITVLPIVNGGTGTATPSLVAGTNVIITGTFPNQNISAVAGTDTTIVAGSYLKSTTVSKIKTLTVDTSLIQTVLNKSAGLIIGTSIDTTYPSANYRVDSFLINKTDSAIGNTIKIQARPGSTIAQQQSIYLADANKATYDWIDFRLGANDALDSVTYPTVQSLVTAYQKFIDTVNATKKTSCKILLSAETPCRKRYDILFGNTIGDKFWTRLSQLNDAVMGGTLGGVYTRLIGTPYRENYGFEYLTDGNGNLAVPYDTSSLDAGVHPNNAGKKMMAYGLRKALNQMGFLKVRGENPPLPGVLNSIPIYYGPNGYAGNQYLTFNTPSFPYGMNITNPNATGQSFYYSTNNLGFFGASGMNGSTELSGTNSYYAGNWSIASQKGLVLNAGTANTSGSNSFIEMQVDGFGQPLNGLLLTNNNLRLFSSSNSGAKLAVSDTSTNGGANSTLVISAGSDSALIFQNNVNATTYKTFTARDLNIWKPNSGGINLLSEAGKVTLAGFGVSAPQIAITSSTTAKINASLAIVDGTQGTGKVFVSDANGTGSWSSAPTFSKLNITTGSNATVGTSTLSGGTVTVSTTAVTASSKIFLTDATTGALTNIGTPTVGTVTAGVSFVINSSNVLDTSNINWLIIN